MFRGRLCQRTSAVLCGHDRRSWFTADFEVMRTVFGAGIALWHAQAALVYFGGLTAKFAVDLGVCWVSRVRTESVLITGFKVFIYRYSMIKDKALTGK